MLQMELRSEFAFYLDLKETWLWPQLALLRAILQLCCVTKYLMKRKTDYIFKALNIQRLCLMVVGFIATTSMKQSRWKKSKSDIEPMQHTDVQTTSHRHKIPIIFSLLMINNHKHCHHIQNMNIQSRLVIHKIILYLSNIFFWIYQEKGCGMEKDQSLKESQIQVQFCLLAV